MTLDTRIIDTRTGEYACVDAPDNECSGVVVATRPLKAYENTIKFFTNTTQGVDMNVDGTFGPAPEYIHDGTDNMYWTGSNITGANWVFNSAAQNHTPAGALSVDATATVPVNVAQFLRGGGLLSMASYSHLTLWVYLTAWANSMFLQAYDTTTGLYVGNRMDVAAYINTGLLNTWQQAIIPLSDMAITGDSIDSIRFAPIGAAPDMYIDDIQLEDAGGYDYVIQPDKGTWLHVKEFNIFMADAFTGIVDTGQDQQLATNQFNVTLPGIPYNSLLGVSALTSGLQYSREQNGDIVLNLAFKQLGDFLQLPGSEVASYGGDGTNTWLNLKLVPTEPVVLKAEHDDKLQFSVFDDLTGLLQFRISAGCKVEQRE